MRGLRRLGGSVLMAWGAIRFLPDLLESMQATVKYGKWVYAHLSAPQGLPFTIAIIVIGIGLIFSETIQARLHRWMPKVGDVVRDEGPDLSLEWMKRKEWPHWDLVRMRNFGDGPAFNIGLRFSWDELSFNPPFDKNILHSNQEITQEAHFSEKTGPGSSNIGYMDEILKVNYFKDRTPPLQVIASFSDGRGKLEKPFTFELGPGGTNAERIRITPGPRKRI
jgi:hypothetical protein